MVGIDTSTIPTSPHSDDFGESIEGSLLEQLHELHRRLAAVRQSSHRLNEAALSDSTSTALGMSALESFNTTIGTGASVQKAPISIPMAHKSNKIVVVSLENCVRMSKAQHDDSWQYTESNSGLKSAIDYIAMGNSVEWVSWPGAVVDESSQDGVRRKLISDFNCHPVFLNADTLDLYKNQFCNVILWSLLHSLSQRSDSRLLESFVEKYDAFSAANQKFLEVFSDVYNAGDLVLICDFQLMALPGLLRRRFPDITCAFYFHCPFPSPEFFQILPAREALLQGILGADLVVFNHYDYVRHFLSVCTRMLGLESSPSRVEYNGRLISLGVCPMGVDPVKFQLTPVVQTHVDILQEQHQGLKVLVAVARLDFCQGIPELLEAMDYLLDNYPQYREKVVLYAVVREVGYTVSKPYELLNRQIDELVGRVNGRYGTAEYVPVKYLKRPLEHEQLVALYRTADVAIVSSIKEGINLQAMEFIAAQQDSPDPNIKETTPTRKHGVLVYSEFAGCASSLQGALLVNPMDFEHAATQIHQALEMPEDSKKNRHKQLSRYVKTYTSSLWSQRVLGSLNEAALTASEYNRQDKLKLDTVQLLNAFERGRSRLFLLDYDGTLIKYQCVAELAVPPPSLLACLEELANDPLNKVYIISGRSKESLTAWFSHLPQIGLAAEHGYWFRPAMKKKTLESKLSQESIESSNVATEGIKDSSGISNNINDVKKSVATYQQTDGMASWQCMLNDASELDWRDQVQAVLEQFTEQTPGSMLDVKDCSFTWHYRDADRTFGAKQARDIQLHFDELLRDRPVGIVMCHNQKYVEIRPWGMNKGRAASRIIEYENEKAASESSTPQDIDFILAMGDERTDEDMFDVIQGSNCFTCTVGKKVSRAQYYLDDPDEVMRVLTACTSLSWADTQKRK